MDANDIIRRIGTLLFRDEYIHKALLYSEAVRRGDIEDDKLCKALGADDLYKIGTLRYRDKVVCLANLWDALNG